MSLRRSSIKPRSLTLSLHLLHLQSNDEGAVPQVKYNFVELSALDQMEKDQTCGTSPCCLPCPAFSLKTLMLFVASTDVLAVIKEVGDLGSITGKASQKPVRSRVSAIQRRGD